ncbi:MAG TPA: NlpC/P60 family protein [Gaiellales bacterium]|jgi:cell wall-associated NlpC family hydrolase
MASAETGDQNARAVEVLQRLLSDPEFRRTFRRDPSGACLAAGLDDAAAEFTGTGSALQTLELRESKSSLAGLLMAAAAEGAAVYQFAEHARSNFGGELADLAHQALDKAGSGGGGAAHQHAAEHVLGTGPAAPPALGGSAPGVMADAAAAIEHAHGDPGGHVVNIAKKYIGTPYVWGGESPSGFDCSGLVQYCYKQIGVHLDRTTWDQVKEGHAVEWGHFKPGDLIFSNFEGPGAGATHVVIYAGHGQVIAAPHTGGHVEYESVDVFKPYFMGARRVVPDTPPNMGIAAVSPADAAGGHAPAAGTMGMSAVPATPGQAAAAPAPNAAGVHSTLGSIQLPPALQGHGGLLDGIIGAYPGDHASRSAIASWMGDAAQRAGLPRELPVMAALVESGLKNDHYGDRDSLGFFQMRTSIWDHGKYAGFSKDPRLQLKWFIDEATALKAERLHEGIHNFGTDPHKWGDWIADIERPAAQYRYRYQLQLNTAQQLVGA